jgi:hypothetical protein
VETGPTPSSSGGGTHSKKHSPNFLAGQMISDVASDEADLSGMCPGARRCYWLASRVFEPAEAQKASDALESALLEKRVT